MYKVVPSFSAYSVLSKESLTIAAKAFLPLEASQPRNFPRHWNLQLIHPLYMWNISNFWAITETK